MDSPSNLPAWALLHQPRQVFDDEPADVDAKRAGGRFPAGNGVDFEHVPFAGPVLNQIDTGERSTDRLGRTPGPFEQLGRGLDTLSLRAEAQIRAPVLLIGPLEENRLIADHQRANVEPGMIDELLQLEDLASLDQQPKGPFGKGSIVDPRDAASLGAE